MGDGEYGRLNEGAERRDSSVIMATPCTTSLGGGSGEEMSGAGFAGYVCLSEEGRPAQNRGLALPKT